MLRCSSSASRVRANSCATRSGSRARTASTLAVAASFTKDPYFGTVYHKYGLLKDDFYIAEVPGIKEAIRRLPTKVKDARDMRLKRAFDLSMKKELLPEEQWTKPAEDVPYLEELLAEVNRETKVRNAFRSEQGNEHLEVAANKAAHFAALHKARREPTA